MQARTVIGLPSLAVVILLSVAITSEASAGAWLQEPGAAFVKTSWLRSSTSEGLDCRGHAREVDQFGGRYQVQQVFGYAEYGARDWLTLIGSWSFKDQRIRDARIPEYGTRSTGDIRVGARLPLRQGRVPVSVELVTSLPTYAKTELADPVAEREQFLPAGSGHAEFEASLLAGVSLYPLPLYGNAGLTRRQRGGAFGDEWSLRSELGFANARWFAKTEVAWTLPTGDTCASATVGNVSFHERVVSFSPELAVRATRDLWVNVGLSTVLSGRNTLDGEQFSLGFSWIRR